jgi:hypothetical protein
MDGMDSVLGYNPTQYSRCCRVLPHDRLACRDGGRLEIQLCLWAENEQWGSGQSVIEMCTTRKEMNIWTSLVYLQPSTGDMNDGTPIYEFQVLLGLGRNSALR